MSQNHTPLNLLKRKYTKTRHQIQDFMAVYADMLRSNDHEGDYFKARIDEMMAEARALEQKFIDMGGNVSRLD